MVRFPRTAMNDVPVIEFVRDRELSSGLDYQSVITTLCHEVALAHFPQYAEALVESALQRESYEPTFVGRGLSVPHARVQGLTSAVVYHAHCSEGIDWAGQMAHYVVLLAVPEEQPELYLRLLSQVIRQHTRSVHRSGDSVSFL